MVIDAAGAVRASGRAAMAAFGANPHAPTIWRAAAFAALAQAPGAAWAA